MIIAVTMVRDEADVIATILRHLAAEGVDHLIVADNLSTDGTSDILAELSTELPLTVLEDDEIGYYQSAKMSRLAARAAALGADWVLPFDADEVWYGVDPQTGKPCRIAEALAQVDPLTTIVRAPGWDHIIRDWEHGGDDPASVFSPWRKAGTQPLAKVAFRPHPGAVVHMGNHDVDRPGPSTAGPLAFRHFQYRSLEQMTRKLRNGRQAYEATDIHPVHGTHWRAGGLLNDDELAAKWADLCSEEGLVFDPAPLRVEVGS